MEIKAHINLIDYAINNGISVSVYDGEGTYTKPMADKIKLLDLINSVEESQVEFWAPNSKGKVRPIGWALIILGLHDNEIVADFSDIAWMTRWFESYQDDYVVYEIEQTMPKSMGSKQGQGYLRNKQRNLK